MAQSPRDERSRTAPSGLSALLSLQCTPCLLSQVCQGQSRRKSRLRNRPSSLFYPARVSLSRTGKGDRSAVSSRGNSRTFHNVRFPIRRSDGFLGFNFDCDRNQFPIRFDWWVKDVADEISRFAFYLTMMLLINVGCKLFFIFTINFTLFLQYIVGLEL